MDLKNEPGRGRHNRVVKAALKTQIETDPTMTIGDLSRKIGASFSSTQRSLKPMEKVQRQDIWVLHALG
jgi:molecular chaperone DnaK (HSP70)